LYNDSVRMRYDRVKPENFLESIINRSRHVQKAAAHFNKRVEQEHSLVSYTSSAGSNSGVDLSPKFALKIWVSREFQQSKRDSVGL
jgi:hypothetical protein